MKIIKDIKTGSTFIGKSEEDIRYEEALKEVTVEHCVEFSKLCFEASNRLANIGEGRREIKVKVEEIKATEKGNESALLKYLEHLILDNGNNEFIIPYYSISKDLKCPISHDISVHENHYFGVLGNIHDILEI